MHVLIIPSEEFVPVSNPMVGIFQYHQAKILHQAGYKVGVLSITQSFSLPMFLKAIAGKAFRQKLGNATDGYSVRGLLKLGYDKMFRPKYFITKDSSLGMPVFRIDGFYYKPPVDNYNQFGWIKAGLAAFDEYVKEYGNPDVVHAHNAIYAGMLAQNIQQKYAIPYVLTEHSTVFARKLISDKNLLHKIKNVYIKGAVVTAVSEPFCQLLNDTFGFKKFLCLPNVLDQELEEKEWKIPEAKENTFVFINIAELHPKKDHWTLIKAFKKLQAENKNVQLWIGGEGELSKELRAFVKEEQLMHAVHFLGSLTRQKVSEYLNKADCFVLPSKFETFGVVVIEAMLFGKPVIVTECGGPESFVSKDMGIIVEKENIEQLSEAMAKMVVDYNNYRPGEIREYAIDQFGKNKFLKRITEVYRSAGIAIVSENSNKLRNVANSSLLYP